MINWMLRFGGKVKVLEASDIAEALQGTAKNVLSKNKQDMLLPCLVCYDGIKTEE